MVAQRHPVAVVTDRMSRREIAPRALIALLAFHGALQILVIGTGLIHLPLTGILAWLVGVISISAAAIAFHFAPAAQTGDASRPARACALLGALVLTALAVLAWIKIDPSFDGNWYHIPVIHFWAAKGYVHWVAPDPPAAWCKMALDYMNGYPNAHEVTSFWLARLAGDRLLNAASMLYLPLGALGVHVLSRRIGVPAGWSALGALLYLLMPVNIAQAHTTYVDSSFAACVVALLALMALLHDHARNGAVPPPVALATGIALGLIVGIKGNGPLLALLAGFFIAASFAAAVRHTVKQKRRRYHRAVTAGLALIVLAALATGGYWNLRNWLIGGSPVYPIGITLGGVEIFPGEPFEKIVNTRGQTPPEMRDWPAWKQVGHTWLQGQSLERWHGALGEYASRFGGLSFLWLLGALPASIALAAITARRRGGAPGGSYLYLFAFVLVAFLLTPNNWWARYTLWIFGIGLPAFVYCASRPLAHRWASLLKWCWVLACCALFLYESTCAFQKVANAAPPFWRPTPGTAYWKPAKNSLYNQMLADPQAPVALYNLITRRQSILGTLCQPIGQRPVYFLSEETAADPQALATFIQEKGIRYLITGEKGAQPKGIRQLTSEKQHAKTWNINIYAIP